MNAKVSAEKHVSEEMVALHRNLSWKIITSPLSLSDLIIIIGPILIMTTLKYDSFSSFYIMKLLF